MRQFFRILLLALAGLFLSPSARAVTINISYDASVTNLSFFTNVVSALAVVTNAYHVLFTNTSTVNITCYWGAVGPFSGSSVSLSSSIALEGGAFSYAQVTNALRNARSNADDTNAIASLPGKDPFTDTNWYLPRAEAKALNLGTNALNQHFFTSRIDVVNDGDIAFAPGKSFTFSPTNRAVSGKYDFIGDAEHEISEVMGRTSELDVDGDERYIPFDLFRFTGSGTRSFDVDGDNVYFSVNNGTNALKYYNDYGQNGGDPQDWLSDTPQPDSYDAFANPGEVLPLSPVDLTAMSVLGYALGSVPQPHLTGLRLANGTFQISFTNISSAPFSVFATTNISLVFSNWTYLGPPAEVTTGHYQFVDVLPNKQYFYQVRFP